MESLKKMQSGQSRKKRPIWRKWELKNMEEVENLDEMENLEDEVRSKQPERGGKWRMWRKEEPAWCQTWRRYRAWMRCRRRMRWRT